jgi:hypothetical protein
MAVNWSTIATTFFPHDGLLAMSGEAISDQELFILFEAARWAPSLLCLIVNRN